MIDPLIAEYSCGAKQYFGKRLIFVLNSRHDSIGDQNDVHSPLHVVRVAPPPGPAKGPRPQSNRGDKSILEFTRCSRLLNMSDKFHMRNKPSGLITVFVDARLARRIFAGSGMVRKLKRPGILDRVEQINELMM